MGQRRKKEAKEGEWGEEERRSWGRENKIETEQHVV